MKVTELIECLQELAEENEDMEVRFSYDYGDHCHTAIATLVDRVDVMPVSHSDYISDMMLVDEDDADGSETMAIILR